MYVTHLKDCFLKDSCQAKLDESKFVKNLKVVDWKRTSLNETDIALQLMHIGPLSIALNAELLQFYFGGVFDPFDSICHAKNLNHAVLMVGWGINQSRIFGKQPYWIVKNRLDFRRSLIFLVLAHERTMLDKIHSRKLPDHESTLVFSL